MIALSPTQPTPRIDAKAAIANGIAFLTHRQGEDGDWQDFNLPVGASQDWVTAMIGRLLLVSGCNKARKAASRAAQWLNNHNTQGQWSYNKTIEPDCDSTAWAALLFQALGEPDRYVDYGFIRSHQTPQGGFRTYRANDAWGEAHACVTPVAMLALEPQDGFDPQAVDWVLGQRTPHGAWPGYWWSSAFYPTLMAYTVLTRIGGAAACPVPSLFQAPELAQIRSPVDLACATIIAHLGIPAGDVSAPMVRLILGLQDPDGGWPMSNCLHLVPHWVSARTVSKCDVKPGQTYSDVHRLLSTAFAVAALSVADQKGIWL